MSKVKVTIITGFLGSGKTTLINRLLTQDGARRYAVIVNEFGSLGIDSDLILSTTDNVVELTNGCLCCSVRGDLIDALEQLRPRLAHLDGIIVETSGLADPVPVAQTFLVDRDRGESYDLDGVITLVDALHAGAILETEPEAVSQVAFADRLVLTKCDLVPRHRIEALKTKLLTLNPTAPFLEVDHGHLDCTAVMDLGAFDMAKADMTGVLLRSHSHAAEVQSLSLFADRPLDMEQFLSWMQQVMVTAGQNILRTKGIIDLVGETRRFVFQGVQTVVDGDAQDPWPSGVRESRMVIIGRDLRFEELRDGWVACIAKTNSDMM